MRKQSLTFISSWLAGTVALLVLFTGTQALATGPETGSRICEVSDGGTLIGTVTSGYAVIPGSFNFDGTATEDTADTDGLNSVFPRPVPCPLDPTKICPAYDIKFEKATTMQQDISHVVFSISSDRTHEALIPDPSDIEDHGEGFGNINLGEFVVSKSFVKWTALKDPEGISGGYDNGTVKLVTIVTDPSAPRVGDGGMKAATNFGTCLSRGPGSPPVGGAIAALAGQQCVTFNNDGNGGSALIVKGFDGCLDLELTEFHDSNNCSDASPVMGVVTTDPTATCSDGVNICGECITEETQPEPPAIEGAFAAAAGCVDTVPNDIFIVTLNSGNDLVDHCYDFGLLPIPGAFDECSCR